MSAVCVFCLSIGALSVGEISHVFAPPSFRDIGSSIFSWRGFLYSDTVLTVRGSSVTSLRLLLRYPPHVRFPTIMFLHVFEVPRVFAVGREFRKSGIRVWLSGILSQPMVHCSTGLSSLCCSWLRERHRLLEYGSFFQPFCSPSLFSPTFFREQVWSESLLPQVLSTCVIGFCLASQRYGSGL